MHTKLNHLILDFYNEAQTELANAFATSALSKAKSLIPFDSAGNTTFSFTPTGQATIIGFASLNVHPNKGELRAEFIGQESFSKKTGLVSRDPLLTTSMKHPGKTHRLSCEEMEDKQVLEYARRSCAMQALCYVNFYPDRDQVATLSFWRESKDNPFSAAQLAASDLLMPHLIQALTINRKLVSSALIGSKDQHGVIIAETGGAIHYIDDLSVILLRREFPRWLSHILPEAVIDSFRASRQQHYIGKHVMLNLHRQDRVMVIGIKPRSSGETLTPAELRVIEKIVQFGSYKETARQLDVSPATVRNQLHAIYRKLGIRDKSSLLKAFSHTE